ncbi:unnamed protein product, partial [Prorocentrum cordatum]
MLTAPEVVLPRQHGSTQRKCAGPGRRTRKEAPRIALPRRRYRGRARERGSRARACRCTARGRPTRRAPPERGGGVPARGPCCGLALEVGARQRGANTELWRAGARAENRQGAQILKQAPVAGRQPRMHKASRHGGSPSPRPPLRAAGRGHHMYKRRPRAERRWGRRTAGPSARGPGEAPRPLSAGEGAPRRAAPPAWWHRIGRRGRGGRAPPAQAHLPGGLPAPRSVAGARSFALSRAAR